MKCTLGIIIEHLMQALRFMSTIVARGLSTVAMGGSYSSPSQLVKVWVRVRAKVRVKTKVRVKIRVRFSVMA